MALWRVWPHRVRSGQEERPPCLAVCEPCTEHVALVAGPAGAQHVARMGPPVGLTLSLPTGRGEARQHRGEAPADGGTVGGEEPGTAAGTCLGTRAARRALLGEGAPCFPLLPTQTLVPFMTPSGVEFVASSASCLLVGAPTTQTMSGQHWWRGTRPVPRGSAARVQGPHVPPFWLAHQESCFACRWDLTGAPQPNCRCWLGLLED